MTLETLHRGHRYLFSKGEEQSKKEANIPAQVDSIYILSMLVSCPAPSPMQIVSIEGAEHETKAYYGSQGGV